MPKFILVAVALLTMLAPTCASRQEVVTNPGKPDENRGEILIAELVKRDAAPYRKVRVRFTIIEEGEPPKVFELVTWRRQRDGETATLTQIVRPAEDSDLASLAVESPGRQTVITSYIGSRGEFRESGTNRMFFGGLTAGELLGEWSKFSYRFVGETELNGAEVNEVEGRLKKGQSGLVERMTLFLRQDDGPPVEVRLYDGADRHLRTFKVTEVRSDARGQYAVRTEVENRVHGSKTVIEVLSREFPENADDGWFTREKLKQIAAK